MFLSRMYPVLRCNAALANRALPLVSGLGCSVTTGSSLYCSLRPFAASSSKPKSKKTSSNNKKKPKPVKQPKASSPAVAIQSNPLSVSAPSLASALPVSNSNLLTSNPGSSPSSKLSSLWSSIRAMYVKNRDGIKVLVKQDLPRYRLLKRTPVDSLSRADAVFLERVRSDLKRLIPFGILVFVLPEIIPFLVIRGFVPSTCMDAMDRHKQWTKLRTRREEIAIRLWTNLSMADSIVNPNRLLSIQSIRELGRRDPRDFHVGRLKRKQIRFILQFLGYSPYTSLHPYSVRVLRILDEIEKDDKRILKEPNCIQNMTDLDLAEASEKRGISTVPSHARGGTPPSRKDLEFALHLWIEMNTDPDIPRGLALFARIIQSYVLMRNNGTNLV